MTRFFRLVRFLPQICSSLLLLLVVLVSCNRPKEISSVNPTHWEQRQAKINSSDSLDYGSSYLSVYSEIYSLTEKRTYNLTATISIRNISSEDSIYILRSDYYNTAGDLIRTYFNNPIFLKPLETIEIVVDERDEHGGTGANFIFDWAVNSGTHEPLFEAVMISTSGQQGISFTTSGVKR
ncbi:DUF3124 domain-containing protein [uncultured Sunxiuqinia sp.]|uniref:DUF3124 domain-containing protein n=1 Tax=uncultured Sunxiuqinia sp. TaxID=1573825 RepID=UPI002AA6DEC8|nr:DUF3124 domain-containing protein [uncultured Sunxiuqinia sp.]